MTTFLSMPFLSPVVLGMTIGLLKEQLLGYDRGVPSKTEGEHKNNWNSLVCCGKTAGFMASLPGINMEEEIVGEQED